VSSLRFARAFCRAGAMACAVMAFGQAAHAQQAKAAILATYFEALPGKSEQVAQALQAYAARLAAHAPAPRVDVLREIGRPNRLALVESWPQASAPDSAALAALQNSLEPLLQAPSDARRHLALTKPLPGATKGPFHMLMHVDVVPAGADMAARELADQRAAVLAGGGLGFEAATQEGKPNHFAVHEIWPSRAAYAAYAASPPARHLRAQLATAKGALFDDRFFTARTFKGTAMPRPPYDTAPASRDLAPSGRLRVAINLGNAVLAAKDPQTGALSGVSVTLAKALGEALNVPVDLVPFVSAGETFDALTRGEWDLGFMAIDPLRAEKIRFSAPYVVIEGTYMLRKDAPFHTVEDLDRPGLRIAVARGSAYDLFLSRQLKNATLVRTVTTNDAIALFKTEHLDAVAGIRQALAPSAPPSGEYFVMSGRFMRIEQAIAVPIGHATGAAFTDQFIRKALADGVVSAALTANGQAPDLAATSAQGDKK
jgi:polar amino acid transport system substrate-binding protein